MKMQFYHCLDNCPLCDVLERENFKDSPVMAKSPLSVKSYLQLNLSPTEKFGWRFNRRRGGQNLSTFNLLEMKR